MVKARTLLARRRLLVTAMVLSVLAVVAFYSNSAPVAQLGTTSAVVAITQTVDAVGNVVYAPTDAQIDVAVREAVELAGGLPQNVGPGKKIVIQPNIVEAGWIYTYDSHRGVCTHRQVVRTLIHMCLEAGAAVEDIAVCEGAAGFHGSQSFYGNRQATRKAYVDVGLDLNGDMIEDETGVQLVDANYAGEYNGGGEYPSYPGYRGPYDSNYVTQVSRSNYLINHWNRPYYIPNVVAQCDVLIRVPVFKNHDLAGMTSGLKLAFGIAPSDIYHAYWLQNMKWNLLHQTGQTGWPSTEIEINSKGMVDMTLARPPDLVVVDALVGIMSGPTREPLSRPNPYMAAIIASHDVVALDTICALAAGYQVSQTSVPAIYYAQSVGLGTNNPGKIEVRGKRVAQIRRWFPQWGNSTPGERVPPSLTALSLPDGLHVCGKIYVRPTAYNDMGGSGVCKGELYINGVLVDSSDNASGTPLPAYTTSWATAGASSGQHILTYRLYDGMLNESAISRTINVHAGDPLAAAFGLPDGTSVSLGPVYVSGFAPAIDGTTFFVSSADGLRGLKVKATSLSGLSVGQEITMYGSINTVAGQRHFSCGFFSPGPAAAYSARPKLFNAKSLGGVDRADGPNYGVTRGVGPYNIGCLVTVVGRVSAGGSDYFYIDDGSLVSEWEGPTKLKVLCGSFDQPAPGDFVSVTGFSCVEEDGAARRRLLVARSQTDIVGR